MRTEIGHALHMSPEEIGAHATFATLGVDSLLAMELRSRLQAALGAAIPVAVFIESPDVSTLAERLLAWWEESRGDASNHLPRLTRLPRYGSLMALSFGQEQLWFLHELVPSSSAYNVAVSVRIRGPLDPTTMQRSLDAIVARHEALRRVFGTSRA